MLKGPCPECGGTIELNKGAASFSCPECGTRFEVVEKDGRRVARRVRSANPVSQPVPAASRPGSQPRPQPSNPFSREKRSSAPAASYEFPSVPPSVPTATSSPAKKVEILLRMQWVWMLLLLVAAILLFYPVYGLASGSKDITLPGIGTLEARPKLEQDNLTTTTTAYVTETSTLETRRRGSVSISYEVRYQFSVNGVWYTHSDDTGRKNLWYGIDKDEWDRVSRDLKSSGQATFKVKYVTNDPWDNRPLAADVTIRTQWMFLFIGVIVAVVIGLWQSYAIVRDYFVARKLAAHGVTGKLKYWEIVTKKT